MPPCRKGGSHALRFQKEQKELYQPKTAPALVHVPKMNYLAVRGKGDPNDPDGEYARSIPLLYGVAYTLKMSPRAGHVIDGFFDYTVPPLEGFWWQPGLAGVDYANKAGFHFLSLLRLPDFVTRADFDWAVQAAAQKKKMDLSLVEFFPYDEGLCVQCMHSRALRRLYAAAGLCAGHHRYPLPPRDLSLRAAQMRPRPVKGPSCATPVRPADG